jgi:predicted nucleic acid-binding protein
VGPIAIDTLAERKLAPQTEPPMSVLVDSTVWSLALRRTTADSPEAKLLAAVIAHGEARIIGAVRQEVLSGIRTPEQFARVRDRLAPFPDLPLSETHYVRAAEFYNACRSRGVQGSATDFLICAAAQSHRLSIFTTDADFTRYAAHLPIRLLKR